MGDNRHPAVYYQGDRLHKDSRWKFVKEVEPYFSPKGYKQRCAEFICDCGTQKVVHVNTVKRGVSLSCGCLKDAAMSERSKSHGLSGHYLAPTYYSMIKRCYEKTHRGYASYGGRGIEVCDSWLCKEYGLKNFISDMGDRPEGCTLDRINTNGNYSPDNCRWADGSDQVFNRRRLSCNTSGTTGVYWSNTQYLWYAHIKKNGKTMRLGQWENYEDAVDARRKAEVEYFGYTLDY